MNKFIGIGNLTRDIEVEITSNNKLFLKNAIAIRNDYKNANGEYDSEFINIVVFGPQADYMGKYAEKGMKVAVEGRLTTKTYEKKDGSTGYAAEIVCTNVELLGRKNEQKVSHQETKVEKEEKDPFEEFGEQIEIDNDNFLE